MTTYNIHDLVWSRGVSEPVREAMLAMNGRIAELSAINDQLLEALELALRSHGVMLLSDPPQDAWKTYGVEAKARAAIKAAKGEA